MSLSSTTTRVSYSGNSSTTAFPITFSFWDDDDLSVILTTDATGAQTTWVKGADYTVTGGSGSTGTLTATTAPASGTTLSIISNLPNTQPTSLPVGGNFPSATVEQELDQIVRQVQQLKKLLDRALVQPDGDSADIADLPAKVSRASLFLAFDANGDPIASTGTTSVSTPVSAFAATLLDDASASVSRTTLGLGTIATKNSAAFDATLALSGVALNEAQGANIASVAGTTDIGAATGTYVKVTGTNTITGFGTIQAGTKRIVEFTGALTITHNASSLILPDAANLKTVAGDVFIFVSEGSGNWRCVSTPVRLGDGAAKAWANIAGAGTNNASLNVSGVVRNSAGDYTISFTTPFSSANYVVTGAGYGNTLVVTITTQLAGSCNVVLRQSGTGTATDAQFTIAFFGRQ